jgi:hypothetical protein
VALDAGDVSKPHGGFHIVQTEAKLLRRLRYTQAERIIDAESDGVGVSD